MTSVQHDMDRLNRNLSDYVLLSRKTISEVLDKKGNDLRIQLFRGFWAQRFGGKGGGKSGIAWMELVRRTKAGIGTLVRKLVLEDSGAPSTDGRGKPLTLWQKLVWQETKRRQAGIGLLGVSFLSKRWRTRKRVSDAGLVVQERFLDRNVSKTLGTLVEIRKDATSFTIHGMTPGLREVSDRYGIQQKALQSLNTDMEPYLARKFGEAYQKSFRKAA